MRPRVLETAMDYFVSTEKECCLKGMHFAIFRSEIVSFCTSSFLLNVEAL